MTDNQQPQPPPEEPVPKPESTSKPGPSQVKPGDETGGKDTAHNSNGAAISQCNP